MFIDPDEFYQACKQDFKSEHEVDRRNAVSRTYYAAYHHVMNTGIIVIPYSGQGVHQSLINTLQQKGGDFKKAAFILRSAKKLRTVADYHLEQILTSSQAETIEKAYQGIKELDLN